ncbi:oxidoreductase [Cohnella kolymensis]|uniref:Oxidoreductase n=1 Tax=Cohnella kolymensis TaxID=1590652 RepID=A0ABR5A3V8_9BACL|nr:Gfo/Idh/MocA family oxidoreductase [Cohnella kolymensis]KIL35690.1 oxidoreductase [Cohnella kolymensis]
MNPLTAVLLGAGARGAKAYAPYALKFPHDLKFVAVAEPNEERRMNFAHTYGLDADGVFSSWEETLARPRMADIAIIGTQDRMHFEPAMKALELGYHVLLEKPISPDPIECVQLEQAAHKYSRLLTICHVLRYTPFWSALRQVVQSGQIGKIASIQLNENVGFFHMAHSFVRGNWRNSDESSPMILAKSCHDMDVIFWLMDEECKRVTSFGSLIYFHQGNAPEGAPDRCLDGCPAARTCPYYAPGFYLGKGHEHWAGLITDDPSSEGILRALNDGPYGRCVYKCDNNVVDHQVVNMEFASGATVMFSMSAFTHEVSRSIQIMGTAGEIRGHMESNKMTVYEFASGRETEIRTAAEAEGHGGGDAGIVASFLEEVRGYNGGESITSASASVRSHLMAFAAEESRKNDGKSVNIAEFRTSLMELPV